MRKLFTNVTFTAGFALAIVCTNAKGVTLDTSNAWARLPRGHSKMTGVFLDINNLQKIDDQLISAHCDCAEVTEIHESSENNGMVKMQRIAAINFKPGETVALKPGSYHIMLMGLKKPLVLGETIKLELNFKAAGTVTVEAKVKAQ